MAAAKHTIIAQLADAQAEASLTSGEVAARSHGAMTAEEIEGWVDGRGDPELGSLLRWARIVNRPLLITGEQRLLNVDWGTKAALARWDEDGMGFLRRHALGDSFVRHYTEDHDTERAVCEALGSEERGVRLSQIPADRFTLNLSAERTDPAQDALVSEMWQSVGLEPEIASTVTSPAATSTGRPGLGNATSPPVPPARRTGEARGGATLG